MVDESTAREILRLEDEMQRALVEADVSWFEANWASDARYVHLSGRVDGREAFVHRLVDGDTVHSTRESSDLEVRSFGPTAVVTGAQLSQLIVRGTAKTYDTRFTRVYVQVDGRWLLVSSQSGANTFAAVEPSGGDAAAAAS